jgi:glycerol-3-phosphate dehydrogenase
VRKSLAERELLLRSAPHIMWPMRFVMPHNPAMRPAWMIRAGLFLYDHLAQARGAAGLERDGPARPPDRRAAEETEFTKGFVYSDGWVDDARLVVLNAIDAAEHGATVLTRTGPASTRGATPGRPGR